MVTFDNEIRVVLFSSAYLESRLFYEQVLGLQVQRDWDHGAGNLGVVYQMGEPSWKFYRAKAPIERQVVSTYKRSQRLYDQIF